MPSRDQFTACIAVLFDRPVAVEDVADALVRLGPAAPVEASESWEFSGPAVVFPYRPEVNGSVVADAVDQPWPDGMGDPPASPDLAAAWEVGAFGPFTASGNLSRAGLQSWAWPGGKGVLAGHRAFVRLRTSYVLGSEPGSPAVPDDYDPVAELRFLTDMAVDLLGLPGAVCLFVPGGETVRPRDIVTDALGYADSEDVPPLDLWANVRLFDAGDGWKVMDTVGHAQLERPGAAPFPDLEAGLPPGDGYDPQEIDGFLRNVAVYLLEKAATINAGDTIDGPGDVRWRAKVYKHGLIVPPRPTVRFFPDDGTTPPPGMLADPDEPAG